MEKANRFLAILYAITLGVAETAMNWGNWQYAPLWFVDYFVVAWLLFGVLTRDREKSARILIGAWAFALSMMYMALAIMTEPISGGVQEISAEVVGFIGGFIATSIAGLVLSYKIGNKKHSVADGKDQ
ncbi:MAG: hypothetical protein COA73_06680 [Candidatus Hydrogenedentota bacterium]|nr:MAG: hypothetical protein COA73_06680 [Candidatus Hydrogenedentota bacterium]